MTFDEKFRIAICAWNNVPTDHVLAETQCLPATRAAWVRVFEAIEGALTGDIVTPATPSKDGGVPTVCDAGIVDKQ